MLRQAQHRLSSVDMGLFPFYGGWRFRRDVVGDAIDARDFINNARADAFQECVRQSRPIGRHAVLAGYRPNGNKIRIRSAITHNADAH